MVNSDPRQLWRSVPACVSTARQATLGWLRAGGAWVLGAAVMVMLLVWVWPLGVGSGPGAGVAGGADGTPVDAGEDDRQWVQQALRKPLGRSEEPVDETVYEEPPISEVVLVGLSYRRQGRSVGFFRIDGGGTEILAEDEESQGMKVLRLAKDHAVVERDGERMELRRIAEFENGGGAM